MNQVQGTCQKWANLLRKYAFGWILMIPALTVVLAMMVYPLLLAFKWSFYHTKYVSIESYAGISNYLSFFFDPEALHSIYVSLVYCFGSLLPSMALGIGIAVLLSKPIKFRIIFRTILILPWVISYTVTAMMGKWVLNPDFGPLNYFLSLVGLPRIDFLGDLNLALPTVIMVNTWKSYPLVVVLTLAALQSIPVETIEAAEIDGASRFVIFMRVKLPLIRPMLLAAIIMLSSTYLIMVTLIYVLTGGGPLTQTQTLSVYLFKKAFVDWKMGYACVMGVF